MTRDSKKKGDDGEGGKGLSEAASETADKRASSTPMRSLRRRPMPNESAAISNLNRASKVKDLLMETITKFHVPQHFEKTPFRCAVLRAHYSWMSNMFFLLFFYASSTYYGEHPIRCIDQQDRSSAARDVLDICIQFPFTTRNNEGRHDYGKIYATYYMWVHWSLLFVGGLFKSVQVACYLLEDKALKKFISELQRIRDYDIRFAKAKLYFQEHYGNHKHLVKKVLVLHVIALLVNVIVFFTLDFMLNFNYATLPHFLINTRDMVHFDDPYSLLFPPFVECEISPLLHIREGRTNFYGCHLPLMEIYEKVFMGIWFLQVFLALWVIISMCGWLFAMCMKKSRLDAEELFRFKETRLEISSLPLNEIIVLNLVKNYLFGENYRLFVLALLKWNPNEERLNVPEPPFKINFPCIREGLHTVVDEGLETFFEDIRAEIPHALKEDAFNEEPHPEGWKLDIPLNSSFKPKPSAPRVPFDYRSTNDKNNDDNDS